MTSVLSTITYIAEDTYRFGFELGNVMKSAIQTEAVWRAAIVDRTTTIVEVSV